MSEKNLLIGSHVGMNAPDYYLGSVKEALSYGATTFMFYTGSPQMSFRKPLNECKIEEARALIKEAGIDESKIVVHGPYFINGANIKPETFDMSVEALVRELQRTEAFGCSMMVLHPGSHVNNGVEVGINSLDRCLDLALAKDGTNVKIAIETKAGKGAEIGITFEQVRAIIDGCKYPERLGVCLDTCHIHDAGYDVFDVDNILSEFDRIIGLDRLLCVHINDSKNVRGAHKDRHENLGYGEIGFEVLNKFVHHPLLVNIPKILETPYIYEKPPYKQEIDMLKDGQFIPGWREKL